MYKRQGKSTTLRMIAGLEEISKGEMYIGGRLINDVPPKDRDIAMVLDLPQPEGPTKMMNSLSWISRLKSVTEGAVAPGSVSYTHLDVYKRQSYT